MLKKLTKLNKQGAAFLLLLLHFILKGSYSQVDRQPSQRPILSAIEYPRRLRRLDVVRGRDLSDSGGQDNWMETEKVLVLVVCMFFLFCFVFF